MRLKYGSAVGLRWLAVLLVCTLSQAWAGMLIKSDIEAIFAEEFGFIGVLCLLGLYVLLVWRIFSLSKKAVAQEYWYGVFVLIGFGCLISGQTLINLGVNAGFLPTKGLTLPFVSYGGSSLMVTCAMVGMMLRIGHE